MLIRLLEPVRIEPSVALYEMAERASRAFGFFNARDGVPPSPPPFRGILPLSVP